MFDICPRCGAYSENKPVDDRDDNACIVCRDCGHRQPFLRLPLFVIGGVSGTGKTTLHQELVSKVTECVVLDSDLLWRAEFATPENDYYRFRATWLLVAANIAQSGRPVALFGIADPERYEQLPARQYFSAIHYLLLTCDDEELVQRLQARPAWRQSGTSEFIEAMLTYNRYLKDAAAAMNYPVTMLDTGKRSVEACARFGAEWIRERLV
jgi:predicted kinase